MGARKAVPGGGPGASSLEKARLEFLAPRLEALEETTRLQRFLGRLEAATHWTEPPVRFLDFKHWTARRVESLGRYCSAEALQEALADSSLFGAQP